VTPDASVRFVISILRFGSHLGIDRLVHALTGLIILQIRFDVTDGAGRNRHISLRDVEPLHLRDVDVTGGAAYVVAARLVTKLYRETLRPLTGPGPEPLNCVRRKHARQSRVERSRALGLRVIAL